MHPKYIDKQIASQCCCAICTYLNEVICIHLVQNWPISLQSKSQRSVQIVTSSYSIIISVFRELVVRKADWDIDTQYSFSLSQFNSLPEVLRNSLHLVSQDMEFAVWKCQLSFSSDVVLCTMFLAQRQCLAKKGKSPLAANFYGRVCAIISLAQYPLWIRPWDRADSRCKWCTIHGAISGCNPFFVNSPLRCCLLLLFFLFFFTFTVSSSVCPQQNQNVHPIFPST